MEPCCRCRRLYYDYLKEVEEFELWLFFGAKGYSWKLPKV